MKPSPSPDPPHLLNGWHRIALFAVGAVILILELEFHSITRWPVVAISLVLMGVVTIEQLMEWGVIRRRNGNKDS